MKLQKFCMTLITAVSTAVATYPALAQPVPVDGSTNLPGPGIFGLVVLGIAAAVGIARWRK